MVAKLNKEKQRDDAFFSIANIIESTNITMSKYDYSITGGFALELILKHRKARDIDIVIYNPQIYAFFNPDMNDFIANEGSELSVTPNSINFRYQSFKFNLMGLGPYIDEEPMSVSFNGQEFFIETPEHIIKRKIYQRVGKLTTSDIYDIFVFAKNINISILTELSTQRPKEVLELIQTRDEVNDTVLREIQEYEDNGFVFEDVLEYCIVKINENTQ